jgi:hypothetical protein
LLPIRDMQRLDNSSDYAEGFRKRKRSPKVKSKTIEVKKRRLDGGDEARRTNWSDLRRVLSNMDWTEDESIGKDDCFQMETYLMDALVRVRQQAIAISTVQNSSTPKKSLI